MREIKIIPSKSYAHRAMICNALSEKKINIICPEGSKDIEATKRCMDAVEKGQRELYCGESGSTLRFLLPVAGALGMDALFYPEGRLPERPLSPLREELIAHGMEIGETGSVPLMANGKLAPGDYTIDAGVSSQYISGLLFALPLLDGDSRIILTGTLQSEDYVKMTMEVQEDFGVKSKMDGNIIYVKGGQKYQASSDYFVEGDWSNACFFLAAGALLDDGIRVSGLNMNSLQGDRKITELLREFGAEVTCEDDSCTVRKGRLRGITIDASQIPDMVPVLAMTGAFATGETVIENAGRLRIKESDRLRSITEVLTGLGADVEELAEGLIINGKPELDGGNADSFNDHRIAMMAAIASLGCREKVRIRGSSAVEKSYPAFFEEMEKAGLAGNIELI